jgi:hypothetical protein
MDRAVIGMIRIGKSFNGNNIKKDFLMLKKGINK